MKVRTITALFFVIVILASLVLNGYVFAVFFLLLSTYCLDEFYRIITDEAGKPNRLLGLLAGFLFFGVYAGHRLIGLSADYLLLAVPLMAAVFIAALYQKQPKPFMSIGNTILGLVYVVMPFIAFFSMGFVGEVYNYRLPLGFMLILWGNDTGAYLVGRFLGRHRLFERISPQKTWEGLAGGVLLAVVTSMVLAHYFTLLAPWQWVCTALIVSTFGTMGDLVESMLKRSQQVKDSGAILPGHGGVLDRFDGLLLAAPAVFAFLKIVL
ncbi:phosphatidate cytidylyltransferase [Parapedobacter sp. DT-150]|uniref:phosphatidate cytidylyltransferase n=1 Tax=Parapedobacter sp. DT-150 TaxID=3396162 RepID=UPI003F1A4967